MKPEDLTILDLEEALGGDVDLWHGKCTSVSYAAQKLVGGHNIYGHYLGYIDADGHWGDRRGFPNHHGWVLLDDGRVLDPTRWSFENVEPYIYIGNNEEDYDEGGGRMRSELTKPCPSSDGKKANLKCDASVIPLFEHLTDTPFDEMSEGQVFWIANLPYERLDFSVADIYETLINNEMGAFIPTDNRARARREGRLDA